MSGPGNPAFQAFVCTHYAELLEDLAAALGVPLAILGPGGRPLCGGEPGAARQRAAARIAAPIVCHGEELGTLLAEGDRPDLQAVLLTLAEQIAERFRLEGDLERMTDQLAQSYDEINLLYSFARILRPEESFETNAGSLLQETAELLERRLLVLHHDEPPLFVWNAGPGLRLEKSQRWLVTDEAALAQIASAAGAHLPDALPGNRLPGNVPTPHGPVHYVVSPVRVGERVSGYVGIVHTDKEAPLETGELRLLACLAEELGTAGVTRKLTRELRELLFHTVRSLVAAIDAKDEYTRGHSERVYRLSNLLGQRLGIAPADDQSLSWAALLHDIGKISIASEVLNKPGSLSPEEMRTVRRHPERGCLVLEPIPQLRAVLPGIRHHHERFDGRGYPTGLRGEAIPLFARIIAVADVYDAITSTRAYRKAHTHDHALAEIAAGAGTQFDPAVVRALQQLVAEGALPFADKEEDKAEAGRPEGAQAA